MTLNNSTPQPGALKNPMLSLGMTLRDVTAPGWPDHDAKNAVNFTLGAKPFVVPKGESLYRVYGGAASMKGAYWSPAPPAAGSTEGDWRGSNAIEYSWNAGENVASYTAQDDIHLWTGGVESQPAQDMDGAILPDFWLVGGATQFFFPFWLITGFTPVPCGPTPWQSATPTAAPSAPTQLVATAGDFDPADMQAAQAFRVGILADALRSSAETMRASAAHSEDATALDGAVANLIASANTILNNIGGDPKIVSTQVRSQVGLARFVTIDDQMPGSDTASRLLCEVIQGAAELSGKA